MPYPSKTPSSERRRSNPSNTTTPSWKLASLLLFFGFASLTTTAAKAPVQPLHQRAGVVAAATVPRHDPFNGLFNPRPNTPHLFGGVPHGAESAKPKRPAKMVKVPYFIEHLITPQRESVEATSITTTTIAATTRKAGTSATSNAGNTLEHDHSSHKEGHCRQSMQIENSLCDYDAVEAVNLEMRGLLDNLVQEKYFKFYKLNLYGTCPFWTENHLCMNKDCGVAVVDEKTIPEEWTSAALGAISSPMGGKHFQPFQSCNLKDQDFCQVDDEAVSEGVYVDLMENPERFTGYSGPSAAKVWDAIYNENCFNVAQKMQLAAGCEQCSLDREAENEDFAESVQAAAMSGISYAQNPMSLHQGHGHGHGHREQDKQEGQNTSPFADPKLSALTGGAVDKEEDMCLEKRVFYRMISGLHASISIHICDEYFNQTSGIWGPNLECFVSRVGAHPDRLENIYFDYSILVRAVTKLSGYLHNYEFCTGNPEEDTKVKVMVDKLIEVSSKSPAIFDEKAMFVGPDAHALKLEFRDHFRNITKIMDCVGCEKCRLWGKVQTSGLGTALKVLFSYNDEHLNPIKHPNLLQRTEIVALFNTLNRVSESVASIARFRTMYMEQHGLPMPSSPPTPPPTSATRAAVETESEQHKDPSPIQSYISALFKDTHAMLTAKHTEQDLTAKDSSSPSSSLHVEFFQGLSAASLKEKLLNLSRHPLGTLFAGEKKASGQHKQHSHHHHHHNTQKKGQRQ